MVKKGGVRHTFAVLRKPDLAHLVASLWLDLGQGYRETITADGKHHKVTKTARGPVFAGVDTWDLDGWANYQSGQTRAVAPGTRPQSFHEVARHPRRSARDLGPISLVLTPRARTVF